MSPGSGLVTASPPGGLGPPLIGQTVPFVREPYAFTLARTRRYGPIWKARLLGETVTFFAGPEAFSALTDPENFTRDGAVPPPFLELLHPDNLLFIDGETHDCRKRWLLGALTDERIDAYLPGLFVAIRRFTDGWADGQTRALAGDLRQLAFDLADHLFAASDPRFSDRQLAAELTRFQAGTTSLPMNLPFTRYRRALRARDRLRTHIATRIAAVDDAGCNVAHALAASRPAAESHPDRALRTDLFGLYFATHSGLTAAFSWLLVALGQQPRLIDDIREEAEGILGDGPPTVADIASLSRARAICREVLRAYPVAPPFTMFSQAARDLEYGGYHIPAGSKVLGAIWATLQDPSAFPDPETFDGERLTDAFFGALPNGAYVPTSTGSMVRSHRCAGEGLVHQLLTGFAAWFTRHYDWDLPAQDTSPGRGLSPLPRSGVIGSSSRRRSSRGG